MHKIQGRDALAWRRLMDLFGPTVYSWCRRAGLKAEDAADVGQEVFQAVATHIADFRRTSPGDTFRGWLWTITHNKIRDFWRRRQGHAEGAGGSAAQWALGQIPQQDSGSFSAMDLPDTRSSLLRRALELIQKEFTEQTWQAFCRVTVEEQAPADVAAALGMSVGAVYIAKSRVVHRLREELAEFLE